MRRRIPLLGLVLLASATLVRADDEPALKEPAFRPLPLGSIKPSGWLKDQLRIQAAGLSGHLDEFWPDIKDSAWTGGKAEGWERAPYWLDGIVPLAYLLDDDALKAKAKRFIDYVLDHQKEDGWIGPVGDNDPNHKPYDPWPLFVLLKALTQYQEATGDPRIIPAMTRCLHKIDEVITKTPLYSWARFRAADLIVSIDWLYDRTHEKWLLDLAKKVHDQGYDWRNAFEHFQFTSRVPAEKSNLESHGVNNGMALKWPAVWWRHSGAEADLKGVAMMLDTLDRYHGQATGIFTCDEHLAGRSPSQGTELCTVVEAMYSLETALAIAGDPRLGDRLERIAFNALPATFKPDMCAHQYDQQANQVMCKVSPDHVYATNGPDSNLFGLEPNFGCCTANMHQGWPKLAESLWMRSKDGGLVATAYAPSILAMDVDDGKLRVETITNYPFNDQIWIKFDRDAADEIRNFTLLLRIPDWTDGALIGFAEDVGGPIQYNFAAKPEPRRGSFLRLEWHTKSVLYLRFPMKPAVRNGDRGSSSIERGPLVYSLPIRGYWKQLKGKPPFADWEVFPLSPWNYALQLDPVFPEASITFVQKGLTRRPFSPESPPIVAMVKGRRVPWWTIEKNAAGPVPESPVESDQPLEDFTLVPYGCTSLRVTEFPVLKPSP
jgi:hypothetical protein